MKCKNCNGFGFVRILNESDEIVEMECPYCNGMGNDAGWTGEAPALAHNQNDVGSNPIPATKLGVVAASYATSESQAFKNKSRDSALTYHTFILAG